MIALLWLLIITAVSLVVVRVGATALLLTGLSREVAEFQAYSAFFGVGYTTRESELIVSHPIRRRIIRDLMLAGHVGLTCVVVPVVVTFVKQDTFLGGLKQLGLMAGALLVLWVIVSSRPVRWTIDRSIGWTLRRVGVVRPADYHALLRVHEGFWVEEVRIPPGHPLIGRTLRESRPKDAGVVILGIRRAGGEYIGTPGAEVSIADGDVLTVYGRQDDVDRLTAARRDTPEPVVPA